MKFAASSTWRTTYPGALVGVLAMGGVANPVHHPGLEARKMELEERLRRQHATASKSELRSQPTLQAYATYYRKFDKTYHVQLQLESIVFKGKSIPSVASLVEAMFMAELEDMLLTAGHDLDALQGDPMVDIATGSEEYAVMNGQQRTLKPGDMFIHDDAGVLSSIIHGPANRARITPDTQRVLFTAYAPPGIVLESVKVHLERLKEYVRSVGPLAQVEYEEVVG